MTHKEQILAALANVRFPGLEQTIAELGYIKSVDDTRDPPHVCLEIATPHAEAAASIAPRRAREKRHPSALWSRTSPPACATRSSSPAARAASASQPSPSTSP